MVGLRGGQVWWALGMPGLGKAELGIQRERCAL